MTEKDGVKDNKDIEKNDANNSADPENQSELAFNQAELQEQLATMTQKADEYYNTLLIKTAEFDNFRKRTLKEKESLYKNAQAATIEAFIPIIDNLERAADSCKPDSTSGNHIANGIALVLKQFEDILKEFGVEKIESVGQEFNPNLHEAVSHITDETVTDNTIVEEFQRGYIMGNRVLRFAMVKVAN